MTVLYKRQNLTKQNNEMQNFAQKSVSFTIRPPFTCYLSLLWG